MRIHAFTRIFARRKLSRRDCSRPSTSSQEPSFCKNNPNEDVFSPPFFCFLSAGLAGWLGAARDASVGSTTHEVEAMLTNTHPRARENKLAIYEYARRQSPILPISRLQVIEVFARNTGVVRRVTFGVRCCAHLLRPRHYPIKLLYVPHSLDLLCRNRRGDCAYRGSCASHFSPSIGGHCPRGGSAHHKRSYHERLPAVNRCHGKS